MRAGIFAAALVVLFLGASAQAATITTTGSGAWSSVVNNAPWPGGVIPAATDDIVVGTGFTLTVDGNRTCNSLAFGSTSGTVTVNAGFTLTVTTSVTLKGLLNSATACTIAGAGSLQCATVVVGTAVASTVNGTYAMTMTSSIASFVVTGTLTLNSFIGTSNARIHNAAFTFGSGLVDVNGTLTTVNANAANTSSFTMTNGSATLNLGNATPWTLSGTGVNTVTLNGTGATVVYDANANQAVLAKAYVNLTGSVGGTKTIAAATTVSGTLKVDTATVDLSAQSLTIPTVSVVNNGTLQNGTVTSATAFDMQAGTVSAILAGAGAFTKSSAGTVILSGANTYTATTTISAGTLQIGNAGATGTLGTGAVTDNAALTFNRTNSMTVANVISGTGTLTQAGTGTSILTGANTYSGTTTISAGTLQIGNAGATGTLGTAGVTNNAALVFNRTNAYSVSNVIGGTGTLTQAGSSTLTLTAVNTYTGATSVSTGILLVDGSLAAGSAVTVSAGATLGGTGAVGGSVTVAGGTLSAGDPDTNPETLATGALSFSAASSLKVQLNSTTVGTGYDQIAVTGAVNLTNCTLNATLGYVPLNGDTYTILTSTGAISNTFTGLANNAIFAIGGLNFQITYNANSVVITRFVGNFTWNGAGADNNWTTGGNWVGGVAPGVGDNLIFGAAGAARKTTNTNNFAAATTFGSIQFTDSGYTLSGNSVTLNGGAAAVNNNFAGANSISIPLIFATSAPTITCLAGGTLTIGGTINNGGLLVTVNSDGATALNGIISGAAGLTKTGAGILTSPVASTFTGAVTLSGGTFSIAADNNLGNAANTVTLGGGTLATTATFTSARGYIMAAGDGTLNVAAATTLTLSGVISGANSLTKTNTGTLLPTGVNTFGGAGEFLTVAAGTLQISNANQLGDPATTITLNDGTTFTLTAVTNVNNPMTLGAGVTGISINIPNNTTSATPIVITGVISGGGVGQTLNLIGNSDAWLSLAGANTYIANLSMANATNLEFNSDASFGDPVNTLIMTNNNAIAAVGATTFTGNRAISINSSFFLANPGTVWINSGVVSGPNLNVGYSDAAGSFTGTVELSGNNTFTGAIAVWCGTLALANNNALGAPASIGVNGATFNRAVANAALLIDGNVTIPQNITTTGNGASTNTIGSLSGTTGTFNGTVTMGSNTFFTAATGSTVTFSNTISGAFAITAGSTSALGTLVFTTAETYTGATTVNGGTLQLKGDTGTLATSGVTLNTGGTLDIDASGVANPNRIPDAAVVTFNGGNFSIEAPANTDRTETVSQLVFSSGDNSISLTPNGTGRTRLASTLAFSRTSGATLNYVRNTGGGTGLAHLTSAAQAAGAVTYATVTIAGVTSSSTYDTTNAADGIVNGLTFAAPVYTSQANTDWNTPSTWTPAGPPTAGSVAIVQNAVTVNSAPANVPFSIAFNPGGSLTQTAGAATTVSVGAGGLIARNGAAATIGGGAIALTVTSATSELIVVTAGTGTLTINNPIVNTNTPALTKSGTGTLKLVAVNTYTGVTTINNGYLLVDGSIAAGSAVSLTGGTLGGTGTVFGTVTSSALGGAISPGDPDSNPGILTTGAVTLNAAADLNIQINGPVVGTNYDQLSVTGAINLGGSTLNSTIGVGYFPVNGTAFTIISSTGAVSGTFAGLPNNTIFPISGQNFKITYNANSVVLTRVVGTYIWNGGGSNNNWSTGFNWVGGVAPGVGDSLLFGAAGAARKTTNTNNIAAGTSFNFIQFQSAGYILNGNGVTLAGGATALNYSATAGANTINNAITFATAAPTVTTIAGGTLTLNGAIDNGGLLVTLASAGATTINGALSNTGGLTSSGAGTVILAGANSYSGTTTISAGSLQIGNAGLTGTLGTGAVTDNAILTFNRTNALTVSSAISGTGTLTQAGTGTTILTGANTYSGLTTISAGTLQIGNAGVTGSLGTAGVTDNGALVFNRTDNIAVSNVVSGTGSVAQAGSGVLTLSGTNTYTGLTAVTAGTLSVASLANGGANSNIGASTNVATNLILDGGTLQYTGAGVTTDRLFSVGINSGTIDSSGAGALNFNNAGAMGFNAAAGTRTLTLTGTNAGSNILAAVVGDNGGATSVAKSNAGTWIFTGTNTYTGTTSINAGTLQIGNGGATGTLGTGAVTDSGALIFNRTAALGVSNTISGTGTLTQNGSGTITLSGTNTYSGATTVNVGTLKAGVATQAFGVNSAVTLANVAGVTLDITGFSNTIGSLAGGGALGGNVTLGAATLTAGGNNTSTAYAGVISGTGGIAKTGTGTLTVSGANAYTGAMTVNGGTLKAGIATQAFGVTSAVTLANTAGVVLDTTGFNNTIGSLTGGGATGGNVTLGAATLTVGSDNTSPAAYAGVISGTGFLTKSGTGTLTLSGTNTFTGGTTIAQGAISVGTVANVSTDQPLGHVPSVTLGSNTQTGTLELTGNTSPSSTMPFTLAAGGTGAFQIDTATNVLTLSGVISSTGALSKTGTGTLKLSGVNTYTGATTVSAGTMLVDGSLAAGSAVSVAASATLGGTGTINGTVTGTGGTLSPGDPDTNPGKLSTGAVSFSSASTFKVQLNGTGAGNFDVLAVTGTLNLTNATLSVTCGYTAANGDAFTIMTSTGARSNLFTGLANNAIFPISGQNFQITYNANSVVLTRVVGNYIWNGAGANDNWSNGANWVGGVAPGVGDTLTFGNAGAARKTTTTNDIAAGTSFNAINFTDAGYTLSGNSVTLTGGAAAINYSATAGANAINNNIAFGTAAPTITTFAGGTLTLGGTLNNGGLLLSVASAGATNLNGVISNSGGISNTGVGSVTLAAAETYTGTTTLSAGTTFVNGTLAAGAGLTTVGNSATLSGTGSVSALTVSSGGVVMPGTPAATGILNAAGNTVFNAGSLYAPLLNGTTLGSTYDQLSVTGTLNVTGATLNVSIGPGLPTTGVTNNFYTIMTSTSAIVGTFNGLPEGGLVMSVDGTQGFSISYLGNAVTLHQVPVLLSAKWIDGLGSSNPGVDAGDTVVLTFSIPVKSTGALIGEIGLPVTGDTFDTSVVVGNATASSTVTITLAGLPQLTPGGTYSPLATSAGVPTGVYIISGIHLKDTFGNFTYSYPTSAAGTAAAVDLLPGGAGVLSVSWDDTTITPRIWDMGSIDLNDVVTASTNTPIPVALNLVNTGTVRQQCTISCSASAPSGWVAGAAPSTDQFQMKADNSVPLTGVFGLNLSTPQVLTSMLYSGQYKAFDLRLTAPTALTKGAGVQQTITVTIVVTQN